MQDVNEDVRAANFSATPPTHSAFMPDVALACVSLDKF